MKTEIKEKSNKEKIYLSKQMMACMEATLLQMEDVIENSENAMDSIMYRGVLRLLYLSKNMEENGR